MYLLKSWELPSQSRHSSPLSNPKYLYIFHRSPSPIPLLSQPAFPLPVFFEIRFNIIMPLRLGPPNDPFVSGFCVKLCPPRVLCSPPIPCSLILLIKFYLKICFSAVQDSREIAAILVLCVLQTELRCVRVSYKMSILIRLALVFGRNILLGFRRHDPESE